MIQLYKAAVAGLVVGVLGIVMTLTPFGTEIEENMGLHLLFKMRGMRRPPPDAVIIALDKASADHFRLPTVPRKWPRSLHARLINKLAETNPAVIVFDMIFSEAGLPENDNMFAEAICNAGNVVLVEWLKRDKVPLFDPVGTRTGNLIIERIVPAITPLASSALACAHFSLPKVPVKVNSYWAFKEGAGDIPTLPIVALQVYAMEVYSDFFLLLQEAKLDLTETLPADGETAITEKSIKEIIRLSRDYFEQNPLVAENLLKQLRISKTLATDEKKNQILLSLIRMYQGPKSRYLNFYGPAGTIRTIPYYQIIEGPKSPIGASIPFNLKGKAVFVGLSDQLRPEQKDGFYTVFSQPNGLDISGVEIAASAFANLLEGMPVRPLNPSGVLATVAFWGILLAVICFLCPSVVAACSVAGLGLIYIIFINFQFKHAGVWYPVIVPLFFQAPVAFFGTVLWKYFQANRERRNIRTAFGYYLPEDMVNQLSKDMSNINSSRVVYGTCLFTDAQKYTAFSETMKPEELTNFMNKYYEVIFEPVRKNSGIVSDVLGDSMMAIWATANPDANVRNLACHSALDIVRAVDRFNQSHQYRQLPVRIGMHSGYISLANVGAIDHYEYRAVGDIVNTTSRMEGLNKYLGTRILVSEEVIDQLDEFFTRWLGQFVLAGKSEPTEVRELICRMEECNEIQKSLCSVFSEGVEAYQKRAWEEAMELFCRAMQMIHNDGPSSFYLKECEKYRANPPGIDWNGTVHLNRK
jgi:adenylate cyclase